MSADDDSSEKSHEATPKRLEDARKRGEIPKSTDLNTAAAYLGLFMAFSFGGRAAIEQIGQANAQLLAQADTLSLTAFSGGGQWFFGSLMLSLIGGLALIFGLPAFLVMSSLVAQRAVIFAPNKITPKLNKISMISGAKNKFGSRGLFEFFKSFVKLILVSVLLGWLVSSRLEDLMNTVAMSGAQTAAKIGEMLVDFLLLVMVMTLAIGGVDYLWQTAEHMKKNRMSQKELKDEAKQSEGDPQFKQTRRQRAYDIAMNQMLSDVPNADVVIVNPTHYSVALKWDKSSGMAPVCVAKGVDEIAARIREIAQASDIPVRSDPPTARAVFATVEVGQPIKSEHYRAVAVAIRFAEDMRRKTKSRA